MKPAVNLAPFRRIARCAFRRSRSSASAHADASASARSNHADRAGARLRAAELQLHYEGLIAVNLSRALPVELSLIRLAFNLR